MFPLVGSMGLPVSLFAFGDAGLALALVYFAIGILGTFTVGDAIAAGKVSLSRLAQTPAIYAVVIAVGMEIAHVDLPVWAVNTVKLLGGIVIPAQLIALGIALAKLKVASFGRSLWLGCLRLAMGVAVGVGVAEAFGLKGVEWSIVVIQSSMPVAVSSYLFAELHRRAPEEVAGMVLVSTAVSFATLPLLLLFVM
jgi:predicted permease